MNYILCGAGQRGKQLCAFLKFFLKSTNIGEIVGFVDKNDSIGSIEGIPVYSLERLKMDENDIAFIITPAKKEIIEFYCEKLQGKKFTIYYDLEHMADFLGVDLTFLHREMCAYWHVDHMDWYFEEAESSDKLSRFWGDNSEFKDLFATLDLTDVIELACGRGRHVTQYLSNAGHITIVDILQKNIDYCKARFGENDKISYYKNNGYDLSELSADSYTSLFCYDAMVHFEMLDVNSYLRDIYRVLKRGGKALLHHSNFDAFCEGSYLGDSLHGRTFMNYKIFAYLAIQAGFKILKQKIIRWENVANLDCITLLQK